MGKFLQSISICAPIILFLGCGGKTSTTQPVAPVDQSAAATITFNFVDTAPVFAAFQVGSGPFTPLTIQNNQLSFTVPAGTSSYILAYVCSREFAIEATKQDGIAFNANCEPALDNGNITASVDASQIAGAATVQLDSKDGSDFIFSGLSGSVNLPIMPSGTDDVAVVAFGGSLPNRPLAVRILRSQTVPGAINGGNPIVLGAADLTTQQPITVNNVPAGLLASTFVTYKTANGSFPLDNSALTQYAAVPATATQPDDFYTFTTTAIDSNFSFVSFSQESNGGPVTATLPPPWIFSGPTPASLPSFQMNYAGFSSAPGTINHVSKEWSNEPGVAFTTAIFEVFASGTFVAGNHSLTIPDVRSLSQFSAPPNSGITVQWFADITNLPLANVVIQDVPQTDSSFSQVRNSGNFIVP